MSAEVTTYPMNEHVNCSDWTISDKFVQEVRVRWSGPRFGTMKEMSGTADSLLPGCRSKLVSRNMKKNKGERKTEQKNDIVGIIAHDSEKPVHVWHL